MVIIIISILVTVIIKNSANTQTLNLLTNVNLSFANNGTATRVTIISPLGDSLNVTNAWIGMGFNSGTQMVIN